MNFARSGFSLRGRESSFILGHAKRALIVSASLYFQDTKPVSGHGDSIESLQIIYLFPLHTTVAGEVWKPDESYDEIFQRGEKVP